MEERHKKELDGLHEKYEKDFNLDNLKAKYRWLYETITE